MRGTGTAHGRIATGRVWTVAGKRGEAAVLAHTGRSRILCRCLEGDRVEFEAETLDRLVDQVAVAVADMREVFGRDAHEECAVDHAREPHGLKPCLERLPVDLLFERAEDAGPLVRLNKRRRNKRHSCFPCLNLCLANRRHTQEERQTRHTTAARPEKAKRTSSFAPRGTIVKGRLCQECPSVPYSDQTMTGRSFNRPGSTATSENAPDNPAKRV